MLGRALLCRRQHLLGRAIAAGIGGTALALSRVDATCDAEPEQLQWLWSFDGVVLRRRPDGEVLCFDEATGAQVARPASVPNEAYANAWRSPPHPDWPAGQSRRRGVTRHLFLVRHAQYDLDGRTDHERTLTELGQRQTAFLAQRLAAVHAATDGGYAAFSLDTLLSSELTRAIETADLLAPALPGAARSRDAVLNEGRPCLPEPPPRHASHYNNRSGDGERIERAFRQLCSRPPPPVSREVTLLPIATQNLPRDMLCTRRCAAAGQHAF